MMHEWFEFLGMVQYWNLTGICQMMTLSPFGSTPYRSIFRMAAARPALAKFRELGQGRAGGGPQSWPGARQTAISLAGCLANGHLAGRVPGMRFFIW